MPDDRTGIVSDEEIQAALAEAAEQASQIPSLDDGVPQNVVHVPVEAAPLPRLGPQPNRNSRDPLPVVEHVPEEAQPAQKPTGYGLLARLLQRLRGLRLLPRRKGHRAAISPPPAVSTNQPDADQTAADGAATTGGPQINLRYILYRIIDIALAILNLPFKRLSADARTSVAVVAITTIVISILAMTLLPQLWPHGDVFSKLERESTAARQTLEDPVPDTPEEPQDTNK